MEETIQVEKARSLDERVAAFPRHTLQAATTIDDSAVDAAWKVTPA
jgi:hypothetical protein